MSNNFGKCPEAPDFIYTSGGYLAKVAVDVVRSRELIPGRDVSIIRRNMPGCVIQKCCRC
ncbi:MAG TPA: hypothetical protein ENH94_07710 [Phycisphaerales bacterium]|nr:hypothetical protein [Phycisphaerales bacterium]